jgi:hypothetical protein
MRGSERPRADETDLGREQPGDRVNRRNLQGFLLAQGRQDAGQTASQHRLARPGWTKEEEIMGPGSGNLQRSLDSAMPADVRKIDESVSARRQ